MKRIKSFDLARGFTVLMIAPIHTVLVYSQPGVVHSWLGYLLGFIAEGPGAQLFMFLMGINFALQKNPDGTRIAGRALALLFSGYVLNILKFLLPKELGMLPPALLEDIQYHHPIDLLLVGDILHFAAISLPIMWLIRKKGRWAKLALLMAIIVCVISPFTWDISEHYFLRLFTGHPPQVFFPVFPWLVYPLTGMLAGSLLKEYHWPDSKWLPLLGTGILLAGITLKQILREESSSFYRTMPADTLIHLSIVLLWLSAWQQLSNYIKDNKFFELLEFCSRNITSIYCVQWPLIIWLLPLFGYQDLDCLQSLYAILLTSISTFSICRLKKYLISLG